MGYIGFGEEKKPYVLREWEQIFAGFSHWDGNMWARVSALPLPSRQNGKTDFGLFFFWRVEWWSAKEIRNSYEGGSCFALRRPGLAIGSAQICSLGCCFYVGASSGIDLKMSSAMILAAQSSSLESQRLCLKVYNVCLVEWPSLICKPQISVHWFLFFKEIERDHHQFSSSVIREAVVYFPFHNEPLYSKPCQYLNRANISVPEKPTIIAFYFTPFKMAYMQQLTNCFFLKNKNAFRFRVNPSREIIRDWLEDWISWFTAVDFDPVSYLIGWMR